MQVPHLERRHWVTAISEINDRINSESAERNGG